MMKNKLQDIDVNLWRGLELTPVDEVLRTPPNTFQRYKSVFSEITIDLNRQIPSAYARTPLGKRFDISVSDSLVTNVAKFEEFLGKVRRQTRENPVVYQVGYERDLHRGASQIRYVRTEFNGQVDERTF